MDSFFCRNYTGVGSTAPHLYRSAGLLFRLSIVMFYCFGLKLMIGFLVKPIIEEAEGLVGPEILAELPGSFLLLRMTRSF